MKRNAGRIAAGVVLLALPAVGARAQSADALAMMDKLRTLQLDQLGNPQIATDSIHPVRSTVDAPHRMLIIPVQYSDVGFDRFKGEPDADAKNQAYLQHLLFAEDLHAPRAGTLTHYYYHQSRGRYYVTGQVLMPVTVDHPSDYYGTPIQNSDGQWRNDVRPEQLVEDALAAAYARDPGFPWEQFDVWDPQDYDGDGVYDEPDGYIDHFVLVFAGKGQASCQGLYKLDQKFNVNAPADLYDTLTPQEQECAQRIWPHRFSLTKNNGRGPMVEGFENRRGGVPLRDGLWVYDYNMQSEYTDVSTFIHEFGHSLGLPDVYAAQTSNSTASWEVMSGTASPLPQEMSAWSRLELGWLEPCMIVPRSAGGSRVQSVYLKTMNDWSGVPGDHNPDGLCDAAMVILPPKIRTLRMGPLGEAEGHQAAYTGQGNSLNHYLSRTFDLRAAAAGPIALDLDAWFTIEADWDYLYVEASTDGVNFERLLPTDKRDPSDTQSVMPSRRGHDGLGTIPGFTGRSGDLDGDGKVETAPGCDPRQARKLAEERVGEQTKDPCEASQWIHASFDLAKYRGQRVQIRFHYFTDMASVEDGALVDNVAIPAIGFKDDFERDAFEGWTVEGFSLSGGSHDIQVPHFYLLEYRDPYATFAHAFNYDSSLAKPGFAFYENADTGRMEAIDFRYRPGVLLWYYNGEYLWSQNEPSQFGPGNGFLLLVDSHPQEYRLPSVPSPYFKNDEGWLHYQFDAGAQPWLRTAYLHVMCFERRAMYFPVDLTDTDRATCQDGTPPAEAVTFQGRHLLYGYTLINELLPGEARDKYKSASSLFDIRVDKEGVSYRLYDRALRDAHSADAPFALADFADGVQIWGVTDHGDQRELAPVRGEPFTAVPAFSDADPSRYLNPYLPFGSANIPNEGLSFQLAEPGDRAPEGSRVKVYFTWDR